MITQIVESERLLRPALELGCPCRASRVSPRLGVGGERDQTTGCEPTLSSSSRSACRSAGESASSIGTSVHSSSVEPIPEPPALRGQGQALDASIGGMGLALDEATLLELVGDRRDVRGVDAQPLGQRVHRHRLVEGVERPVVLEAQRVRCEARLGVVPDPAHDEVHEVHEGGRVARRGSIGHPRSVAAVAVESVVT